MNIVDAAIAFAVIVQHIQIYAYYRFEDVLCLNKVLLLRRRRFCLVLSSTPFHRASFLRHHSEARRSDPSDRSIRCRELNGVVQIFFIKFVFTSLDHLSIYE